MSAFPFQLYFLALAGAAAISAATLPFWRKVCLRCGFVDDPGQRKIHSQPIPLAGGFAIATALIVPLAFVTAALFVHALPTDLAQKLNYGFSRRALPLSAILCGAVGMLILGAIDDRRELNPATKFLGQMLIALLVAASGVRITIFVPSLLFSYFVTVFWILTITNAINVMDNMDGLCAGLGAIASGLLGALAALHDHYLVASLCFLVCGALLGFLPYNFPRASAFLGDAGSHLVGFLLAILSILPHYYSPRNPRSWAVLSPLLILAVPLLDLVRVVIVRWQLGKPFYAGDTNHLSHLLVRKGRTQRHAVLIIWLVAALVGSVAFLLA